MMKGKEQYTNALKNLSQNEISAIYEFSNRIKNILGADLLEIRLFGSKSKGTGASDSDIDILIITKESKEEQKDLIYEVAADLNLYYDVVIIPIITESKVYYSPLSQESYFYKTTQKEGIVI